MAIHTYAIRVTAAPDAGDEAMQKLMDEMLPAFRDMECYEGTLVLTNPAANTALLLICWSCCPVPYPLAFYKEQIDKVWPHILSISREDFHDVELGEGMFEPLHPLPPPLPEPPED